MFGQRKYLFEILEGRKSLIVLRTERRLGMHGGIRKRHEAEYSGAHL